MWATSVETAARKYAKVAMGNVYVITGPVCEPGIGSVKARVPKYLAKLVFDAANKRSWAHWYLNDDAVKGSKPISYAALVPRTAVRFLPLVVE